MTKVITVNARGALTLPRKVREKLGVTRGGQLVVNIDESGEVILRAGVVLPVEIYSTARVEEFQRMNEFAPGGQKASLAQSPMRVFLDANILFSAAFPRSRLAEFLGELQRHAVLLTNAYANTEAARNIAAKQPKRLAAHEKFAASLELVSLQLFDPGVRLAEKDQPILCGAIAEDADFLLAGDKKDFGHLFGKTIRGVKIVNVQMLLAELVARGIVREL